ncbi:hypothetical protein SAMN02745148_02460 [Modicisalibacter ilicicola DSM 19980]|uniref:Uncharacterized protein n=1 Tax=Modicisalibacter ilicicola DSM 19980 TaxID=1121942 RepID=A0A1M5B3Z6_9GAMM|nr:hypothetical protein [Halomonas ilicicola]SHF37175.1 hypothetical protein SAMN02745148_02460 [Halomonas ilicicola DSM 19980]
MSRDTSTKDLPKPELNQPRRAGDSERQSGSRITYLAPLPLPTGYPKRDYLKAIDEINDTWLDYGAGWPTVFGWQLILGGTVGLLLMCVAIIPLLMSAMTYSEAYPFMGELAINVDMGITTAFWGGGALFLIALSVVFYAHQQRKSIIPVRFNRERREVCFVPEGLQGHEAPVFVPWESLMAWVIEGRGASEYGAMQQYGFGLGYAHPKTGKWLTLEFMTPGLPLAISSWEAIRAYMEYEVNSLREIQDPEGLRGPDDPPYEGLHTLRNARRNLNERRRNGEVGWLYALCWYLFDIIELWNLPGYLAEWETRRLKKTRPKLRPQAMEEWSKPLPEEHWAPPSEGLTRLSAEVTRLREQQPNRSIDQIFAEVYQQERLTA